MTEVVPIKQRSLETAVERARRLQAEAANATNDIVAAALNGATVTASRLQVAADLMDAAPALRDRLSRMAAWLYAELDSLEAMRLRGQQ